MTNRDQKGNEEFKQEDFPKRNSATYIHQPNIEIVYNIKTYYLNKYEQWRSQRK